MDICRMMKGALLAVVLAGLASSRAEAGEENFTDQVAKETEVMKADVDEKIQKMLDAPVGVFDLEYKDGALSRLKIKGEAEVSVALRGARGDRQAREKAQRDAKASFSKVMNESVNVVESDAEGFIIKEKDGKETAEFNSVSMKLVELHSSAFLRGVIVLMDQLEGEGDGRKAVVILGWSKKLSDAARSVKEDMLREPEKAGAAPAAKPAGGGAAKPATETKTRVGDVDDF